MENESLVLRPLFSLSRVPRRNVAFDGTNYYIFIFDTIHSPKPCQRVLKDRFVCILHPKPRNRTFVIKTGVFYRDNLTSF